MDELCDGEKKSKSCALFKLDQSTSYVPLAFSMDNNDSFHMGFITTKNNKK
jgi:hypothetical protein